MTVAIEKLRFNSAVAHIYELANALSARLADCRRHSLAPDLAFALREAAELLARIAAPMVPHLAEECWAALGHDYACWPKSLGRGPIRPFWSTTPSQLPSR